MLGTWVTYLHIESGNVFELTHFGDGFFYFWCQGDWGEDGHAAALEFYEGSASADVDVAESRKGDGECGNVLCDFSDYHHLGWVRGDEF